ncbi:MAG: hypothetical protein Q9175_007722 [Cornicularia normoerica]
MAAALSMMVSDPSTVRTSVEGVVDVGGDARLRGFREKEVEDFGAWYKGPFSPDQSKMVRMAVRDGEFAERVEDTACLRLSQREMRQDGNMVLEKGYKVCGCENKDFSISIVVKEKAG